MEHQAHSFHIFLPPALLFAEGSPWRTGSIWEQGTELGSEQGVLHHRSGVRWVRFPPSPECWMAELDPDWSLLEVCPGLTLKLDSLEGIMLSERGHTCSAVHVLSLGFSAPAWVAVGTISWNWVRVSIFRKAAQKVAWFSERTKALLNVRLSVQSTFLVMKEPW